MQVRIKSVVYEIYRVITRYLLFYLLVVGDRAERTQVLLGALAGNLDKSMGR